MGKSHKIRITKAETTVIFLYAFLIALCTSVVVTALMVKAGVSDVPLDRSSHRAVTATCGGAAFVAALGAVILTYLILGGGPVPALSILVIALITVVAIMGLMDDILVASSGSKFWIIAIISIVSVIVIGPVEALAYGPYDVKIPAWAGYLGGVVWVFAAINLINFLDGANGMQALNMSISFTVLLMFSMILGATGASLLCIGMVAGYLGFMPFNVREKAIIFSGDVGAVTAGYVFAITVLIAAKESGNPSLIYIGPMLILPALTDTVLTIVRRAQTGRNILVAHNSHLFQKMLRIKGAHLPVSFRYAGATLLTVCVVFAAHHVGFMRHPATVFVMVVAAIGIYQIFHRRAKALDTAPSVD